VFISEENKNVFVDNEVQLERIAINPKVMVGKPVIRGTRLTVESILGLLAHDTTMEEILQEYPGLEKDDLYACVLFATKIHKDTLSSLV
jgi:uncharacterized protein (DUF433 family)